MKPSSKLLLKRIIKEEVSKVLREADYASEKQMSKWTARQQKFEQELTDIFGKVPEPGDVIEMDAKAITDAQWNMLSPDDRSRPWFTGTYAGEESTAYLKREKKGRVRLVVLKLGRERYGGTLRVQVIMQEFNTSDYDARKPDKDKNAPDIGRVDALIPNAFKKGNAKIVGHESVKAKKLDPYDYIDPIPQLDTREKLPLTQKLKLSKQLTAIVEKYKFFTALNRWRGPSTYFIGLQPIYDETPGRDDRAKKNFLKIQKEIEQLPNVVSVKRSSQNTGMGGLSGLEVEFKGL